MGINQKTSRSIQSQIWMGNGNQPLTYWREYQFSDKGSHVADGTGPCNLSMTVATWGAQFLHAWSYSGLWKEGVAIDGGTRYIVFECP